VTVQKDRRLGNQQQDTVINMNWKIIKPVALKMQGSGRVRNSYLIECRCGTQRYVRVHEWNRLVDGTHKSNIQQGCRKCNIIDKPTDLKANAAYKLLYVNVKSASRRIKREFTLTLEQATTLYKSNCYYCNSTPANKFKSGNVDKFELYYNGIDRVDSKKGYTEDNVVPCCPKCNRAKLDLKQDEFYTLISNIYHYRVQRLSEGSE
jgi:hypothetical protein